MALINTTCQIHVAAVQTQAPRDEEERTIRRYFAPKAPPKVAVEISDADATWKWTRPQADAQGQFSGVALPLLDGDAALEFDPSEVEITQEIPSPFVLRAASTPIPLARRRKPPVRRPLFIVDATEETHVPPPSGQGVRALAIALMMVLVAAASAFAVKARMPRSAAIGVALRTLEESAPALLDLSTELAAAPVKTTGTVTATVKGVRVFVDGKLVGDSRDPLTVTCGSHVVRVGTSGVARIVAVPCGGDVSVAP